MEFSNITYSHEHMVIDLSLVKENSDCDLNVYDDALDELKDLYEKGVTRIVDCSNHGIGRNIECIKKIEFETGIQILYSTGFYKDPFFPSYFESKSMADLKDIMINDIKNGASFIGEIGTSLNQMTKNERKCFESAVLAQKETHVPIITHTTLGTMAKQQVDFFKERKADLSKIIISHIALGNDLNQIIDLLKQGVNVAFDTIGKLNYQSDEKRADLIIGCVKAGYVNQIFMSMDLTRKSHLRKNGGNGYAYLLESFVPLLLRKGLKEKDLEQILSKNMDLLLQR